MKIDLESVRYYAGLGDLVMWAWLAEGARQGPDPLVFHRKRNLGLMTMLGLVVDPEPGGRSVDAVFKLEVEDGGRRSRLDYLQDFLGISVALARPPVTVSAADEAWAAEIAGTLTSPLVLVFPQAVWTPREWPPSYWVDVVWKLQAREVSTVTMFAGDDARFKNTPKYFWNTPLPRIAALMRRAAVVVGNDSFPAHLAGTVGVPTLAVMGPTRPTVFSHLAEVTCMTSDLECTGCHFQKPFRAACDQGCMSLFRLFPDRVVDRVLELIGRRPGG
jgi:ADP-heptose:LPS heptosyltransferase